MKQAGILFLAIAGGLVLVDAVFGYDTAYAISYGALALLALGISATFLWLYLRRTTPLALGMSFSWAGAASVLGWWWLYNSFGRPVAMDENAGLLAFVSLYFVGAVLHFAVIAQSLHLPRAALVLPVFGSIAVSALVHLMRM